MSSAPTSPGASVVLASYARRRDRRAGIEGLLASLAPAVQRADAPLRPIFEEVTRRLVRAEHLRLVEAPSGGSVGAAGVNARAVTVPIPGDPTAGGLVLEAVSGRSQSFDAWELQVLHAAGQLAALVLEIERARRGPRKPAMDSSALAPTTARSPDGAAPLIGSTAVMRMLRHRIERVAATDFIVLVEGGIERVE